LAQVPEGDVGAVAVVVAVVVTGGGVAVPVGAVVVDGIHWE